MKKWLCVFFVFLGLSFAFLGGGLLVTVATPNNQEDEIVESQGSDYDFSVGICYVYGYNDYRYTGNSAYITAAGVTSSGNHASATAYAYMDAKEYDKAGTIIFSFPVTGVSGSSNYSDYFNVNSSNGLYTISTKPGVRLGNTTDDPFTSRPYFNFYWYNDGNTGANFWDGIDTTGAFNKPSNNDRVNDATFVNHDWSSAIYSYKRYGRAEWHVPSGWGYFGMMTNVQDAGTIAGLSGLFLAGSSTATVSEYFSGGNVWNQAGPVGGATTTLSGGWMGVMRKAYTATFYNTDRSTILSRQTIYAGLPYTAPSGYSGYKWKNASSGVTVDMGGQVNASLANQSRSFYLTPASYTVTFDPNGGSLSQTSKTVTYNSNYGTLPTPKRSGYTFVGWALDNGNIVTSTSKVTTTSNHVLTAQWKGNGNVTINITGGTGYENLVDAESVRSHSWGTGNQQEYYYYANKNMYRLTQTASIGSYTSDHYTQIDTTVTITTPGTYKIWARLWNGTARAPTTEITTSKYGNFSVYWAIGGAFTESQVVTFNKSGSATITFSQAGVYNLRFDNEMQQYLYITDFYITPVNSSTTYTQTLISGAYYPLFRAVERTGHTHTGWSGRTYNSSTGSYENLTYLFSGYTSPSTTASYRIIFPNISSTDGYSNSVVYTSGSFTKGTIRAQWEPISVKVNLYCPEDSSMGSLTVVNTVYGSSYGFEMPIAGSCQFDGYYTNSSTSGIQICDETGAFVPNVSGYTNSYGEWIRTTSCSLYAKFTSNRTVTLHYMYSDDGQNYQEGLNGGRIDGLYYTRRYKTYNLNDEVFISASPSSSATKISIDLTNVSDDATIVLDSITLNSGYRFLGISSSAEKQNNMSICKLEIEDDVYHIYAFFVKESTNQIKFEATKNPTTYSSANYQYGFEKDYDPPRAGIEGWFKSQNSDQDNSTAGIEFSFYVSGQTSLNIQYLLSCEPSYEQFYIYLNNTLKAEISATDMPAGFEGGYYNLSLDGLSGWQTLKIEYEKDISNSLGYDCAWFYFEDVFSTGYYYFEDGEYPQSYVGDSLNNTLDNYFDPTRTPDYELYYSIDGQDLLSIPVFSYNGNKYAVLVSPRTQTLSLGGTSYSFTAGEKYFFKVEPIRWRVSDEEISKGDGYWGGAGAYKENFIAVSNNILGFVNMSTRLTEGQGYKNTKAYSVLITFEELDMDSYNYTNFNYATEYTDENIVFGSAGTQVIQSTSGNITNKFKVSSLEELQENFTDLRATPSQLVAFMLGINDNIGTDYWTRDLGSNLNNMTGILNLTGDDRNFWVSQFLGYRLTMCFTEGSGLL